MKFEIALAIDVLNKRRIVIIFVVDILSSIPYQTVSLYFLSWALIN